MKFPENFYLLIESNNTSTETDEFSQISHWAEVNNLRLNPLKTRELTIVFKSYDHRVNPPTNPVICGAEHV